MQLWQHQQQAIDFIHTTDHKTILGMDMGTGKTFTALSYIKQRGLKLCLIIVPKKVMSVWADEMLKHNVRILPWILEAKIDNRIKTLQHIEDNKNIYPEAVIINYDVLPNKKVERALSQINWDIIVLDEAHRIANSKSKTSKACYRLGKKVRHKLALTGTPFRSSPTSIYGIMRFIDDTVFPMKWDDFRRRYETLRPLPSNKYVMITTGYKNIPELKAKCSEKLFVVDKRSVFKGENALPDLMSIDIPVQLPPKVMEMYKELEKEMILELDRGEITLKNILVKVLRLQQLVGGHIPLNNGEIVVCNTEKLLQLEELHSGIDEPCVVFVKFHDEIDLIKDHFENTYELSGRRDELQQWKESDNGMLITQFQAGAEGVDMTHARYTFWYSLPPLFLYQQGVARTERPGAKDTIFQYHLIAQNTIDEVIYTSLKSKSAVNKDLLDYLRCKFL